MNWEKHEDEMKEIYAIFKRIADERGIELLVNYKDWPNVSLKWTSNNYIKQIQFFLESNQEKYSLSGYKSLVDAKGDDVPYIYKYVEGIKYPFSKLSYEIVLSYFEKTESA